MHTAYLSSNPYTVMKTRLPDVGGNIIISRSIPNSLINLILRSTSSLELVSLGLSIPQRLLLRLDLAPSHLFNRSLGTQRRGEVKSRDIPSRSLVQLSTLLIGDGRVLSPLCPSDLYGRTGELGSDSLIYSGLVCYLSASSSFFRDLDIEGRGTYLNQTAFRYRR